MERQVVSFLCRTSDRGPDAAAGTRELGELLGARVVGRPGEPRVARWPEDLTDSRGCLLEAGGQVDDAFDARRMPILLAGECSVCLTTLPIAVRHHPEVRILWLDAHPDFNTPKTTPSGYLGGMCLAGACGLWETGFGGGVDPTHVVMHGVREIDGGEQVLLDRTGVHRIEHPGPLEGLPVFIHLDLDVLDPEAMPASFPVAGGLRPKALRDFLAEVTRVCDVVGAEVIAAAPGFGVIAAEAIAPLLD